MLGTGLVLGGGAGAMWLVPLRSEICYLVGSSMIWNLLMMSAGADFFFSAEIMSSTAFLPSLVPLSKRTATERWIPMFLLIFGLVSPAITLSASTASLWRLGVHPGALNRRANGFGSGFGFGSAGGCVEVRAGGGGGSVATPLTIVVASVTKVRSGLLLNRTKKSFMRYAHAASSPFTSPRILSSNSVFFFAILFPPPALIGRSEHIIIKDLFFVKIFGILLA